jgi:hypothetical protein
MIRSVTLTGGPAVLTLCIRYTIDPRRLADFDSYAKSLRSIVGRCGGRLVDYYLPTKFAGATDTAFGLIDFPTLAAYEQYRDRLAADPDAAEATRKADQAGCIVREERSFLCRVAGARVQAS